MSRALSSTAERRNSSRLAKSSRCSSSLMEVPQTSRSGNRCSCRHCHRGRLARQPARTPGMCPM
jgi:hypothetical protein